MPARSSPYWANVSATVLYDLGQSTTGDNVRRDVIEFAKAGGKVTPALFRQFQAENTVEPGDGTGRKNIGKRSSGAARSQDCSLADLLAMYEEQGFSYRLRASSEAAGGLLVIALFRDRVPAGWDAVDGSEVDLQWLADKFVF